MRALYVCVCVRERVNTFSTVGPVSRNGPRDKTKGKEEEEIVDRTLEFRSFGFFFLEKKKKKLLRQSVKIVGWSGLVCRCYYIRPPSF